MATSRFPMRQVFSDWQMPAFLPEIGIDYDAFFRGLKKAGAQSLSFIAKSAHGNSLFPTEIGVTNPGMKGDIFGEMFRRAKAQGMEFHAYYNMVLDYELAKTRPEWRQLKRDGTPQDFEKYPMFCMSIDAYREQVAAHMEEIVRKYPVDGFFLDLSYFTDETCYCVTCRRKFEEHYGYPLNDETCKTVHGALDFIRFKVAMRQEFMLNAIKRCNAVKPGLDWVWNHAGDPTFTARELDRAATRMSSETETGDYLNAELKGRRAVSTGKPVVFTIPETQGSWGDWTLTTAASLKGLSAIAMAHGCALNINITPYPCGDYGGKLPAPIWDTITETFRWTKQRERFCTGKQPVFSVGSPISEQTIQLLTALSTNKTPLPWDGCRRWDYLANDRYMGQLFAEMQTPLHFFYEEDAADWLERFECIVLPDHPHVPNAFADQLRRYVRNGGTLIADYETSLRSADGQLLPNYTLADLFGVDYLQQSPFSVSYLDRLQPRTFANVARMPLLIMDKSRGVYQANPSNHVFYTRLRPGAKALGYITEPVLESDFTCGYHIYHQHAPAGTITDYPGIVVNRYGKGRVVYFPMPFFKAFGSTKSPMLKEIFRTLTQDVLGVSRRVRITAPTAIRTVITQDKAGWLLHVINLNRELDSAYLEPLPCRDCFEAAINPGWPVKSISNCLEHEEVPFRQDGEWTTFRLPVITDHQIYRIAR